MECKLINVFYTQRCILYTGYTTVSFHIYIWKEEKMRAFWMCLMVVLTHEQKGNWMSRSKQQAAEKKMCKSTRLHVTCSVSFIYVILYEMNIYIYTAELLYSLHCMLILFLGSCYIAQLALYAVQNISHALSLTLIRIHYYNWIILAYSLVCSQLVTHIHSNNKVYMFCYVFETLCSKHSKNGCRAR